MSLFLLIFFSELIVGYSLNDLKGNIGDFQVVLMNTVLSSNSPFQARDKVSSVQLF